MFDPQLYIHESDKMALDSLKAIPGFSALLKGFMSVWNERQYKIQNISSNVRIDEKQLSKYYNMLPPICEKLGIAVPELYLTFDVNPNAYTYGDTNPFIVITSGLLENLPDYLIPTVLAHECGHIACHHTLYLTMGALIINGSFAFMSLSNLISHPIKVAFYYWMRCSEYSADRAAILCDGNADNMTEVCARFAGYNKSITEDFNYDLFIEQAEEYIELVRNSAWNKTLEFMMYNKNSHPLTAVRAYECRKWTKSDEYKRAFAGDSTDNLKHLDNTRVIMPNPCRYYLGRDYSDVASELGWLGFSDISCYREKLSKLENRYSENMVCKIYVDGRTDFEKGSIFEKNVKVRIVYYSYDI